MSHSTAARAPRPIRFLFENSLFLVAGAAAALIWANWDERSYQQFVHFDLASVVEDSAHDGHGDQESAAGGSHGQTDERGAEAASHGQDAAVLQAAGGAEHAAPGEHHFTLHFVINDMLMALFFAIAAKEVWESLLPGGALSNVRRAATPLMATLGGIVGPATIYLAGALLMGQMSTLGRGWAIPCATDIAFSYLVARLIFGSGHPAIAFLLLLAIADDAAGLVILAVAYPSKPVEPIWLTLTAGAIALGFSFRKLRLHSFWWYLLIPGIISWFSFYKAGIHPALGLVPIIPCMPHAHTDLGIFAREELNRHDALNAFEHWWKNPVELVLGLFGLANAGVVLSSFGVGTWLVLAGLLVGKPVGITLFTWLAEKWLKLEVPAGMSYRHIISLGMIAAIGFTVALFVSTAAFPVVGPIQDSVKMGALLSFFAAVVAFIIARMLGVRPAPQSGCDEEDSQRPDETTVRPAEASGSDQPSEPASECTMQPT